MLNALGETLLLAAIEEASQDKIDVLSHYVSETEISLGNEETGEIACNIGDLIITTVQQGTDHPVTYKNLGSILDE